MKPYGARAGKAWALILMVLLATAAQAQQAWPSRPVKGITRSQQADRPT